MKSIYEEVDKSPEASDPNPPASTAAECLAGCEYNVEVAVRDRAQAYQRMADWNVAQKKAQAQEIAKALAAQTRRKRDLNDGERVLLEEFNVLDTDRQRSEFEVTHWRRMAEWWRARVELNLPKTYGKSTSVSDLIRNLAEAKGVQG